MRNFSIFLPTPFKIEEVPRPIFPDDLKYLQKYSTFHYPKGKIIIVVNDELYPRIKKLIEQYIIDLSNDRYFGITYRVAGATPQLLKNFLSSKFPIEGALLVGNLPVAWVKMDNDFHGSHSEFPCDLYFMDFHGTWNEIDENGIFDCYPSQVQSTIWIARLWTPTLNGNDYTLINDYFRRNHLFRKGLMGYSRTALAYVDDDWKHFNDCAFDLMIPSSSIEIITDPQKTDGDNYKTEVNQHRGWAQFCTHSSPFGHSFKISKGSEWVPNTYLRDINPPNAFFYNLFACSNARFTEDDYMAGWYIFKKPDIVKSNGLVAIGSTKTGSMLYFENFYGPMGNGKIIGDAYKDWWQALGSDHDIREKRWFYGMIILGDPILNWWSGIIPIQRDPDDGEIFDHVPRKINFRWDLIDIPETTYTIEIDSFGAISENKWATEVGQTLFLKEGMFTNTYEYEFIGAQRGRWRVKAKIGQIDCPWSNWRYFRFIK